MKLDYNQIKEDINENSELHKSDINSNDVFSMADDTDLSLIVKNNAASLSTVTRDNSKLYGVVDEIETDGKISHGILNRKTDGKDFIIDKEEEDSYNIRIVKEYDKIGRIDKENVKKHDKLIDGSYINESDDEAIIDDPVEYVENNEFLDSVSEFERIDEQNKAEALQEGEDPRTLNNSRYNIVTYKDEVLVVRDDESQDRFQKDTIGIPADEEGDECEVIMNTLKGRRTAVDGVPVGSMSKEELMDKTGSDNINKAINRVQGADIDTIDEVFTNEWKDKQPTDIDLWERYVGTSTDLNAEEMTAAEMPDGSVRAFNIAPYLPHLIQLSEVYNVDKRMTPEEYSNATMTKKDLMMTFSTTYINDGEEGLETVENLLDKIDDDGNIEVEEIVEELPDKIDEEDKPRVARKLLPRIQEIHHRFEQYEGVEYEDGVAKIPMSAAPVVGTGYSTYTYWVKQVVNGKQYENGPYYQSSFRDSSGISSSKYHRIVKSFDVDRTVKEVN